MTVVDRRTFVIGAMGAFTAGAFGAASAAPGKTEVTVDTFPFSRANDPNPLLLDLYRPAFARGPLPVIVFVHGGAFVLGDRGAAPDLKRYFAKAGFAMASIDYRLLPGTPFPGAVEDTRTAVRWLRANAARLGLDPGRIGLWGTSAGAHLVSMAGLLPPDLYAGTEYRDQSSAVSCVLDAYAPTDMAAMQAEAAAEKPHLDQLAKGLEKLPNAAVEGLRTAPPEKLAILKMGVAPYLGGASSFAATARMADPAKYARADAPPFLIMHGLADATIPHGQSVLLYEALAKADATVTMRLIHGLPHSFFNMPGIDEVAGPFRMDVSRHLPGKPTTHEIETRNVFDVAYDFFAQHLNAG